MRHIPPAQDLCLQFSTTWHHQSLPFSLLFTEHRPGLEIKNSATVLLSDAVLTTTQKALKIRLLSQFAIISLTVFGNICQNVCQYKNTFWPKPFRYYQRYLLQNRYTRNDRHWPLYQPTAFLTVIINYYQQRVRHFQSYKSRITLSRWRKKVFQIIFQFTEEPL